MKRLFDRFDAWFANINHEKKLGKSVDCKYKLMVENTLVVLFRFVPGCRITKKSLS